MATETNKVLGQTALAATTLSPIYTVPATVRSALISTVFVCNRSASQTTFRISVAVAGAADAQSQYIYYDIAIPGNDTFAATVGLTLGATDVLRGYAGNSNLTMSVFGEEIT